MIVGGAAAGLASGTGGAAAGGRTTVPPGRHFCQQDRRGGARADSLHVQGILRQNTSLSGDLM